MLAHVRARMHSSLYRNDLLYRFVLCFSFFLSSPLQERKKTHLSTIYDDHGSRLDPRIGVINAIKYIGVINVIKYTLLCDCWSVTPKINFVRIEMFLSQKYLFLC